MGFAVDGIFLGLSITIVTYVNFEGIIETKRVSFKLESGQKKSVFPLTSSCEPPTYMVQETSLMTGSDNLVFS